jgi:hypothetical protein
VEAIKTMNTFEQFPDWLQNVCAKIKECWHNTGANETLNWSLVQEEDKLHLHVAPCYQEVLGGGDDGSIVWTPFVFDIGEFISKVRDELLVTNTGCASRFEAIGHNCPIIMFDTQVIEDDQNFMISIYLEPPAESSPKEIIDTLHNEIRGKCDAPEYDS